MNVIIVGGGKIGAHLAKVLPKRNHKVTLIEQDRTLAKQLASDIDALVIHEDGTDMLVLSEAGIRKAGAVIACTGDDKTNLMVCEISKNLGVARIIARVNNPGNEELFVKLGISLVVPVTQSAVNAMENALLGAGTRILAEIGDGKAEIFEIVVPPESRLVGTRGASVDGGTVAVIYRDGSITIPSDKTEVMAGDVLIVVARMEHVPKVLKLVE